MLSVLYFLFASLSSRYDSDSSLLYMVLGGGEQWGLLLLSLLAAFLIFRNLWGPALGASGTICLLAYMAVRNSLAAAHRIANGPFLSGFSGWGPYQPPGVLHWLALALGSVLLLGGGLWQFMRARDERKAAPQARQDGAVGEFSVAQTGHGMDC